MKWLIIIVSMFLLQWPYSAGGAMIGGGGGGGAVNVEDDVYGAGWNGDSTNAPSQNAVYDKIQTITTDVEDAVYGAGWNGDTTHSPSQNATYDIIADIINGYTFTGEMVFDAGMDVKNGATTAGYIDLFEDSNNGANYVRLIGPASTADITLTFPSSDGDANQHLITNGSGVMSWSTPVGADEAYGAGWNADAGIPEKDDIYDYIHRFDGDDDAANATGGVDKFDDDSILKADFGDEDWGMASITSNVLTVEDFALNADADAGDVDIKSIDKLEGFDAAIYIDMGADTFLDLEADAAIRMNGPVTFANEGELNLPSTDADPDTTGELRHDTTITNILDGGALRWYDGAGGGLGVRLLVDLDTDPSNDDYVVSYDAAADKFYMKADAGGNPPFNDIQDATAASVIAFDDDEKILLQMAQDAAGSAFTIDDTDAAVANNVYLLELQHSDDGEANADFLKCVDNNSDVKFSVQEEGNLNTVGTLTVGSTISLGGDTTLSLADPDIIIKDSDAADGDSNFQIAVDATATGSGAEDIDVVMSAQVNGVAQTFLDFDADNGSNSQEEVVVGDGVMAAVMQIPAGPDDIADDNYSGITIVAPAGEAITQWDAVYWDATDSEWKQADANAAGEFPCRCIAVEAGTDGNDMKCLVMGVVRNDGWNWTTVGATLYLSETPGVITQTGPSDTDDCVQAVGWAISNDQAYINVTPNYFQAE